ncbi:MAG: flippase-like domain-containing protein [Bacteroidia bacterium]|nr:flippase-like domain-containing protein [Bacteroidia bacterium]
MDFFKKYGFQILKWIIFAGSLIFLAERIIFHQEFRAVFSNFSVYKSSGLLYLLVALCLMLLNWGLEAAKWKYAIKDIAKISFLKAYAAVFAGTSVSLFMPNRTGEFVGRIFAIPSNERAKAIFASIASSLSQLIVTIITGTVAIIVFLYQFPENTLIDENLKTLVQLFAVFIAVLSLVFYFKINWFTYLFDNWKLLNKLSKTAQILKSFNAKILLNFLLLSFFRYIVFVAQFYCLIIFFGIEISMLNCILASVLTFYVVTVIPTFTLAEIGIRGSVAVIFFGVFSQMYAEIISASTLLWIINVGIPALIGNVFVAGFKETEKN